MLLERHQHPGWLSNTWLVAEGDGGRAVVVDAGGPVDRLLDTVRERRLRVTHVLDTHHHLDHIAENDRLRRATGARVCAHRLDAGRIPGCDASLEDGQVLRCGGLEIRVLHIPGHTAGQAAYLVNEAIAFTGDTLFRGSVGSTTAPGHTTFADLRRSLIERLMRLPESTRVAPGHADPTTIGAERAGNPFIRVMEGRDPEGEATARYAGRVVRLIVWGRDYDGGFKAWIRLTDGTDETVPGSRLDRR
jgi:glyoxylase-like metal-dependent hydrolase (beta-lactamase superfamily II)